MRFESVTGFNTSNFQMCAHLQIWLSVEVINIGRKGVWRKWHLRIRFQVQKNMITKKVYIEKNYEASCPLF